MVGEVQEAHEVRGAAGEVEPRTTLGGPSGGFEEEAQTANVDEGRVGEVHHDRPAGPPGVEDLSQALGDRRHRGPVELTPHEHHGFAGVVPDDLDAGEAQVRRR